MPSSGSARAPVTTSYFRSSPAASEDDQGYGDASAFNPESKFRTPNVDWLADHEEADRSSRYEWRDFDAFAGEYEPDRWRTAPEDVEEFGHGGGDYFLLIDFLESIETGEPPPIDVYRAPDMTLPGLASMESIREGGDWVAVPDPRDW